MNAKGTKALMEQHQSQKLSFLLLLFRNAAVKQGISSHRVLTREIFLWIGTFLLNMSVRHKRKSCSNKALFNG